MYLIVGLGNPGEKYKRTRHNVGFMAVDKFIQKSQTSKVKCQNYNLKLKTNKRLKAEILETTVGNEKVLLAKPLTFMNNSGEAVRKLLQFNNLTIKQFSHNLYIIHDDLDIRLGKYKIQFGKGPREHGGLQSVEEALGTKNFWRVRIGIENRATQLGTRFSGEEYVLQEFSKEEKEIVDRVILEVIREIKKRIFESD